MMKLTLRHTTLALAFAAAASLATGCLSTLETDDPASGDSAVAFAGFALTDDDESDDGFDESADTSTLEEELGDALDEVEEMPSDDEVDPNQAPEPSDRIARTVLVTWGKPVLDPDEEEITEWQGQISSNVAGIRVLRKVRFEDNDELVRDDDPQAVTFRTQTRPHHDGLLLRVVAPRDASVVAGIFQFRTTIFQKTIPMGDLMDGFHRTFRVADTGTMVHISTVPEHRCPHGALRIRWQRKDERGGIFGGRVYKDDGAPAGKVMGIWGMVDGKRRFKGVYRNADGTFRGTLRGTWRPFPEGAEVPGGVFTGQWKRDDGEVRGALGGVYKVGDEPGQGVANGYWRTRCADQPDGKDCRPADALNGDPAADCGCDQDDENGQDVCSCEVPAAPICVPPEPVVDEAPIDGE